MSQGCQVLTPFAKESTCQSPKDAFLSPVPLSPFPMLSPTAPPLPGGTLLGTGVESSQSQVVPTWEEVPEWNPHPIPIPIPKKAALLGLPSSQP